MWIALSSPKKEKGIINSPYLVENNLIIVCFFFCIIFKQLSSF